jgi:hypothetical protein
LTKNVDEKAGLSGLACLIHQTDELGEMNRTGIRLGQTKAAAKVPVVHAFRQGCATLTRHVFSDVMLARLKLAVGVSALNVELEYFFHGSL